MCTRLPAIGPSPGQVRSATASGALSSGSGSRSLATFSPVTACSAAGAAVLAYPGREDASASTDPSGEPSARIRVFNAQRGCQDRTDRHPQCSLGLAIDPERAYTAENVVSTRVWHGDVLRADCQVPRGVPVTDEEDLRSALWARLPHTGTPAWLPAVRTKDRPPLPRCPRSVPAG